MHADLTLQEQILLMCLNDETGSVEEVWLDCALEGAALAELFLQNRLDLHGEHGVEVQDAAPTGDPLLDRALARIAESHRIRPISEWVGQLYHGDPTARDALFHRLVERGILREEDGRVLWVFHRTTHPAADPEPESDVRASLRHALQGDGAVTPRLALLAGILQTTGALDRVFTPAELGDHAARVQEITRQTTAPGGSPAEGSSPWPAALLSGIDAALAAAVSPDPGRG